MDNLPSRFKDRQRLFAKQKPRHFHTKKEMANIAKQKAKSKKLRKEKRREKAKDVVREHAKQHRREMTPAETLLWSHLQQWRKPFKCHPQHAIGFRIADFAFCVQRVIVEVDGGYHLQADQRVEDAKRTMYLKKCGFSVIRFTNDQVMEQVADVLDAISERIGRTTTSAHVTLPPPINEFDEMLFNAVR